MAPTLLEINGHRHAHFLALLAPYVGEDDRYRDAAAKLSRQSAEDMGLDYDELHELVTGLTTSLANDAIRTMLRGIDANTALMTAGVGAMVALALTIAERISGVAPVEEIGDLYDEHPRVARGGWICDHGRCTVLGVDHVGKVAIERDGVLVRADYRLDVDAFLEHFRRIDDVPIIGGEG